MKYLTLLLLLPAFFVSAEEHEVGQKNKAFTTSTLTINKGDVVKFSNQDPFFHNIYSLSDSKFFDLGSFPKGKHKKVTFDKQGTIKVECAIHPEMQMTIKVEDE
ncbi:plastocyanin/azurin family copper-binding protein [Psychromonas sp. Urea-02u-13]|uniref:plastocyanin/azurin family copper-binding protein n=1 Tax=Psychromonas sp. Urea-02u-13 TaxID=2058326 RepID=UPI000C331899|nr:plastocyanin/azurin family copper-binding protein [Psychromonas sp. Urea-02u-13]PKG37444.1 methylamine utilization protein [Psychromonas sp. Urea-02u-13]